MAGDFLDGTCIEWLVLLVEGAPLGRPDVEMTTLEEVPEALQGQLEDLLDGRRRDQDCYLD